MHEPVDVQLRIGRAPVDPTRGGVPPRARDQLARQHVLHLAVDALADHRRQRDGRRHRAIRRALQRTLDRGAQLRVGERPHDADALRRRVRQVKRDHPRRVGAGAPQRLTADRMTAVHHRPERVRRQGRVGPLEAERGRPERAQLPAPGRLDDVAVLEVVVAALVGRRAALEVLPVGVGRAALDLGDGEHAAG